MEAYKEKMIDIHPHRLPQAEIVILPRLITRIRTILHARPHIHFLEAVCYWYLTDDEWRTLHRLLTVAFPFYESFVFAGTDWNHHSYQAACRNDDTLFLLFIKQTYDMQIAGISSATLTENLHALQAIAYATAQTLQNAVLFSWNMRPIPTNRVNRNSLLDTTHALLT